MLKVIVAETKDFSQETKSLLNANFDLTFKDITESELGRSLDDFDIFWFRLKFKLTATTISLAKRCKYIVCPVTGLDHIDLIACEQNGITVVSLKGEVEYLKNIRATAEHTIGLTLSLLRKIPQATLSIKNNVWNRDLFKGEEIFEKKVGILGVGRLGAITASYFKAFGADVYGYDIKSFNESICKSLGSIEALFSTCEIISIHVNLNSSTHHLINKELLCKMKIGSFLINTSRGAIIHSIDLINEIKNGRIFGAAIDVIEQEFDFNNDPLVVFSKLDSRVLITPHIGGNTKESFLKTEKFVFYKLLNQVAI